MLLFKETFNRQVTKSRSGEETGPDTLVHCKEALNHEAWGEFSNGVNLCCHGFLLEASANVPALMQKFDDDLFIVRLPFPVDVVFTALCLFYTGEILYSDLVLETVDWHTSLLELARYIDSRFLRSLAHDMILGLLDMDNWIAIASLGEKLHFPQLTEAAVCMALRQVSVIAAARLKEYSRANKDDPLGRHFGLGKSQTAVDEFLLHLDLPGGNELDVSTLRRQEPWLYLLLRNKLDDFLKTDEQVRFRLRNYADFLSKNQNKNLNAQLPWKEITALGVIFLAFYIFFSGWNQQREIVFRTYTPRIFQDWVDSIIIATAGSYIRLVIANVVFIALFLVFLYVSLGKS